jgi:hypothetical protein
MPAMRLRPLLLGLASTVVMLAVAPAASAAPAWAPVDSAAITPGVQTFTEGAGQCTANFVFHDAAGEVFIGQAAHCASTDDQTATNGCEASSLPIGTEVEVEGATRPGVLAYSSWLEMQAREEQDADACDFNDFALVRLDAADRGAVNPSIPFWGGPTGLNTSGTDLFDRVFSYGNSSLRLGLEFLKPKDGGSLGTEGGGWNHPVTTLTPGIPGDSGSAFLDGSGRALGVLSTLAILPVPGSNGVSDLARALDYLRAAGGPDVTLARGTAPFRPRTVLGVL